MLGKLQPASNPQNHRLYYIQTHTRMYIIGAHPSAEAYLVQRVEAERGVSSVQMLQCDGPECVAVDDTDHAAITVVVVLSALFVLACIGIGAAVMSKREQRQP
jgi:hypothetical protein